MSYIILEQGNTRASVVMERVPAVPLRASLWRCGPFRCRAEWLPPPGTSGWNLDQVSTGPGSSVATSLIQLREFHHPEISLSLSIFLMISSVFVASSFCNLHLSIVKSLFVFWSLLHFEHLSLGIKAVGTITEYVHYVMTFSFVIP